ncbi:MmgE/PrpD family protein [Nocardioides sp. GY 10127]|uniref:MmgE/PrpD family protein n=1 Tax=Nocardioides sp. GY 10127 TaxID=2569762 RepID=UPI0010A7BBC4|nr:MmgE/PrpD family protein [Nocardioides sp. GY 10127]TIC81921.1 MmgE/PrpD family protein [Nocardioides sp. GY 10127]
MTAAPGLTTGLSTKEATAAGPATGPAGALLDLVTDLRWADVPAHVRRHVDTLTTDLAAVCRAGVDAPATAIAARVARATMPGEDAVLLGTGERCSVLGAAFANAVLANVLDQDDGHPLVKGHPGAVVVPAALAVGQLVDATPDRLAAAILVGYEVGIAAAVRQHERWPLYHGSGSWGAVAAASAAASLLGLDRRTVSHAWGLAEYHGPVALVMRSVAQPAMTKDGIGWGAHAGVAAALLAAEGFTATPSQLEQDPVPASARTEPWQVLRTYLKPWPCCRWAQPGIAAALEVATQAGPLRADDVESLEITTFAAAAELQATPPADTEQAQYNVVWPVLWALLTGDYPVAAALGGFDDPALRSLAGRTTVRTDEVLTAQFPARRRTRVEVRLRDGRTLAAGPVTSPGDPGDPGWAGVAQRKAAAAWGDAPPPRPVAGAGLAALDADALLGVLHHPVAPA